MPAPLVRDAIAQSRTRDPLIAAMALLNGSRVLAYMDLPAAKQAFANGVEAIGHLPLDTRTMESVRHEMVQLGVSADPEFAVALYKQYAPAWELHFSEAELIGGLARHGDTALALSLLEDLRYLVEGAQLLILADPDPAFQRRVMQAAKARWPLPRRSRATDSFYR